MFDRRCTVPCAASRFVAGLALALADPGATSSAELGPSAPNPNFPKPSAPRHSAPPPLGPERVQALVTLAQQGDQDAYGVLYEHYVDLVYRYAYLRTRNRQVAEDLTSETFLRGLRRIDSFVWQGRDIAAWFLTITRNLVFDLAKSSTYRLEVSSADLPSRPDDSATSPEEFAVRREREEELLAALRLLTPEQAECLVLRFMEGLSLAESAEILGRSENAVKQLQLRALRAMRRGLGRAH